MLWHAETGTEEKKKRLRQESLVASGPQPSRELMSDPDAVIEAFSGRAQP